MADTRVRVPLGGKTINLAQLDRELGGHGLCASTTEVVAVEGSPVTAQQLTAAVDAHVADPAWVDPGDPERVNEKTINTRLDDALTAMRAHIDRGTFTAAQRDAALLLVLRVCVGVVRLLRRRLDAVD